MYYGTLPNAIQTTLDGDDRAGICSIYPNGSPGCSDPPGCGDDQDCVEIQGQQVCDELHDGPGAFCSKTHIDCAGMCWVSFFECSQVCLFTNMTYTRGYCSPLCGTLPGCTPPCADVPCPDGFHCVYLSQYDVSVCYEGAEPDGGDGADGGDAGEDGGLDGADLDEADAGGDNGADDFEPQVDGGGADEPTGTDDRDAGRDAGADPGKDGDDGLSLGGGGCSCSNADAPLTGAALLLALLLIGLVRTRFT
jgi:MYXO-CTERM domain-containing protein